MDNCDISEVQAILLRAMTEAGKAARLAILEDRKADLHRIQMSVEAEIEFQSKRLHGIKSAISNLDRDIADLYKKSGEDNQSDC